MRIYCINLEHRIDRKQHSMEQFTRMGVSHDTVVYPHFTKDYRGGVYGCFDSHMKVWNDFFVNCPDDKYCLILEDDFVAPVNYKSIIEDATKFIEDNYNNVDILFLHDICVKIENKTKSRIFTNGYGVNAHAYLITRRYIQSIITNHGKLPEPNGRHVDYEISTNVVDKDNMLYSEKLFYTNKKCFTQLIDKSDNYLNRLDELFRIDLQLTQRNLAIVFMIMKKMRLSDDYKIKRIAYIINMIVNKQHH
jgi:GR25 family glycosyltransferase involved in LPS biosynthesis